MLMERMGLIFLCSCVCLVWFSVCLVCVLDVLSVCVHAYCLISVSVCVCFFANCVFNVPD